MTNAIATVNQNAPVAPDYLKGRSSTLSHSSADIKNLEQKPTLKMDRGLWLVRKGNKVERMSAVVTGADGVQERIPDVTDLVIVGFTEVTYSYFTPGAELGATKPVCFSVGGVAPHSLASQRQSATCKNCVKNKEGSGTNGKGKACGKRRVAIGFRLSDPSREIVALQIPTLSIWFDPDGQPGWFGFNNYVTQLNQYETPIEFVVTRVLVDGSTDKPRMNFAFQGYIPQELVEFVQSDAVKVAVKEFREYFEYTAEEQAQAALAVSCGVPAQTVDVANMLYGMLNDPATRPGAEAGLLAMGLPLVPTAEHYLAALRKEFPTLPDVTLEAIFISRGGVVPTQAVVDPLAELRKEFPSLPDDALKAIQTARNTAPAPVAAPAPAPAPAPVAAPATAAMPTPPAMTVPALPAADAANHPTPDAVNGTPDSDEAIESMKAFLAGI